jgi:hypothetical protein
LFDAIYTDFLTGYDKSHIRFLQGSKIIDLSLKVNKLFSLKNDNIISVELYDVIKLDLCNRQVLWIPNNPPLSLVNELRASISFQDVKSLNPCLCATAEEAEERNAEENTMKYKYYAQMLQFNYENKLLVEETDLSKVIPRGLFKKQIIYLTFKLFANMHE